MPTKCSVNGCDNYYSKGVPFFDVPSPLKYKFCSKKAELSKKRRKLWLDAMGVTNDSSNMLRICSKHFKRGKPAALEDTRNADWIPTLHIKSVLKKSRTDKQSGEKRRESSQNTYLSKENASKYKHSAAKRSSSSRLYGKKDDKIIKKDIRKSSKRIDLKKFLNCKVILDGNIQCTTFKGTNGSGLTIFQKHGYFTSDNVTVKETALNNTVLRIHLVREDLLDLKRKYETFNSPSRTKRKEQAVSSFGRQIKRKSNFEEFHVHTPLRKSVYSKTVDNIKYSSEKTERQMKNQNVREEKSFTVNNKLQSRNVVKNISEDSSKTLNKAIKKNYRDKIKIKLFPKASAAIERAVKNGAIVPKSENSLHLHREILFVKNYKTDQQWNQQWNITDQTYFLKFSPSRYPDEGTLDYSFQKLVTDVKHMKLPAPSWKIKVIIRQGKISAVTFTNKLTLERCVGFSVNNNNYKVTIDNKPALLLGSPNHIRSSEDLEILLDIVQNIDSKNPMVFYK